MTILLSITISSISYPELTCYIKRRYINTANVREAIVEVVNAILETRDSRIWGFATTGCACDSTRTSVKNKLFCRHLQFLKK
ncbi:Tn3 family transposase [Rickettsia endosymbiont of Oedothorax gibbosus]|uniref:Tn3 family transposase n=1 Tax=Rickettsia endosymbiont of Oedothorax gibbosus TaxID=931099 RepID=UPI00397AA51A